eukprot:1159645-Pelagomonas_calceolata.AAC.1
MNARDELHMPQQAPANAQLCVLHAASYPQDKAKAEGTNAQLTRKFAWKVLEERCVSSPSCAGLDHL